MKQRALLLGAVALTGFFIGQGCAAPAPLCAPHGPDVVCIETQPETGNHVVRIRP